jgi:26S proteasome regulatory subunit T3
MGDVLVETPVQLLRKTGPTTIHSIDNFEGISAEGGDDYSTLKKLQRKLEYIQLQEVHKG